MSPHTGGGSCDDEMPSYMKVATGSVVASLLRNSWETVPDVFVVREGDEAHGHESLPLFDLSALGNPSDSVEYQRVVNGIVRASKEWGCFQIVGHGVRLDLIHETRDQIHQFFSLPFDQKARIFCPPNSLMGYACGGNRTSGFLWQEGLAISAERASLEDRARRVWPEGRSEFSNVVATYVDSVSSLALQLLDILSTALGTSDPHFLTKQLVPGSPTLRFNYYLPCPQPCVTYGSSPLTDIQALAIVHPDDVGGLEVKKDGRWIPVHSRPDSFVVNIGDTLQVLSNDRYVSVEHRAIVNSSNEWLTLGYYLTPANDAVLAASPELVDSDHPQRYKRFTYEEYNLEMCRQILSPAFKYVGKTALNSYRLRT